MGFKLRHLMIFHKQLSLLIQTSLLKFIIICLSFMCTNSSQHFEVSLRAEL